MRRIATVILVAGFGITAAARGDEARAIVDRAIQAAGGADSLTKYRAAHWKGKGKFYGFGDPIDYTGEWFQQLPAQQKNTIHAEFSGMKIENIRVINGDKGWASNMGMLQELDPEQMEEAQHALHYDRVVNLMALKNPANELVALGESAVDKRPALGVKVSHKGRRDIKLFFDKESGLLIKGVMNVKDQLSGGQEIEQEMHYSGHKEIQGRMVPMKVVIKRGGTVYIENEVLDYKRLEKLDDKVFSRPEVQ